MRRPEDGGRPGSAWSPRQDSGRRSFPSASTRPSNPEQQQEERGSTTQTQRRPTADPETTAQEDRPAPLVHSRNSLPVGIVTGLAISLVGWAVVLLLLLT